MEKSRTPFNPDQSHPQNALKCSGSMPISRDGNGNEWSALDFSYYVENLNQPSSTQLRRTVFIKKNNILGITFKDNRVVWSEDARKHDELLEIEKKRVEGASESAYFQVYEKYHRAITIMAFDNLESVHQLNDFLLHKVLPRTTLRISHMVFNPPRQLYHGMIEEFLRDSQKEDFNRKLRLGELYVRRLPGYGIG